MVDHHVHIDETLVIDFFSLDTEGSEALILNAIDFNQITIGILLVEWNGIEKQINNIRNSTIDKFSDIMEVTMSDSYFGKLDKMFYSKKYFDKKGWGIPSDGVRMYKNERNQIRAQYKALETETKTKKNTNTNTK